MKLSLILLFLAIIQVKASSFAQVTIHAKEKNFEDLILDIQQQSGYDFIYSAKLVENALPVTFSCKNASINEVLDKCLKNQPFTYLIRGKTVTLIPKVQQVPKAEQVMVGGKVTDEQNQPLPGVTVQVKNTTVRTATDADGNFKINAPADGILVFRYIGFADKEVGIDGRTSINVSMQPDVTGLNEVVVVGYGQQQKVNLTGAVSAIDFEKEAESRPLTSVSNALAGLAPGLQALQSSGQPNSDNSTIRIRGTGTLNSSAPLVLIDGMEQTFTDINPADVESISILKDAASASIYGNRAANGVILITSKKGKKGKTDVSYSSMFSFNQPSNLIELVNNSARYMELMNESSANVGQSAIYTLETINKWREAEKDPNGISESGYPNYVAYPNTDWYKAVFRNKLMHNQTFTARGASDKVNYTLSGTYLDNPGLIEGSGLKKYYLRANVSIDVNDWLTVGNRTYGYQNDVGRNSQSTALTDLGFTKVVPSIYPFYDGKYGAPEPNEEDPQSHNTLWDIQSTGGSHTYSQLNTSLFTDIKLFKDLKYHANFDWTRYWREDIYTDKSVGKYSFSRAQMLATPMSPQQLSTALYTLGDKRWRLEQTLTYDKDFGKHSVAGLLGHEEMRRTNYWADVQKNGLIDESITDLSTATTMKSSSGANSEFSTRSFFGRLNYGYDSRYLLEVNLRYDGSSRFAPDVRWGVFPSVSAGWRLSQEPFMKDIRAINELKLRASWGELGNNSIGNYDWQNTYSTSNYPFGGVVNTGLALVDIANRNLRWETTTIANFGLDASFLNHKLSTTIDLYDKTTDGILFRPQIYATMGNKTAPLQNIAEVKNRGVEVNVGWNHRHGDFRYNVVGNFAYNHNRVSKYKGTLNRGWSTDASGNRVYSTNIGDVSTGGSTRILEGNEINEYYLLNVYKGDGSYFNADGSINTHGGPKDGMIRTEQDMQWMTSMQGEGYVFYPNQSVGRNNIWYGDYLLADLNGDGIFGNSADNDFQRLSNQPKYNLGLQAGFTWKNVDFSMNWAASLGFGIYWYKVGQNTTSTIFGYAIPRDIADDHYFYDPENPSDPRTNLTSANPRLTRNSGSSQNDVVSNRQLQKGDFLKLKNLTVGYTLPSSITERIKTRDIRFFLSGENLLTLTGFKGMDPEMQTGMGYVTMRQLALGVNVKF